LGGPESLGVRWRDVAGPDSVIDLVGEEIDHIEAEGYETPRVLVAATSRAVRDRLREAMGFGSWEQRSEHTVVCETVHRVKGLEFDFVVLVAGEDVTDLLLYVGLSRALIGFSLVAPATVAARLGLASSAAIP
jgi:DNA helicase IV